MNRRLAIALVFAACASEQPDVFAYTCTLTRSCGAVGHSTDLPIVGTIEDVKAFAHDWSTGCQVLTEPDVIDQRCDFVVCWAHCAPRSG